MPHVVVLGGGVIGLTTAVELLRKGYKVTIIAAHLPGDQSIEYTSPWAGAHWRTHASESDPRERAWDVTTYQYWMRQLTEDEQGSARSGLKTYESLGYWDVEPKELPWWSNHVSDFHRLPQGGVSFKSISINVPEYLLYLLNTAKVLGAQVIQLRIPTSEGFESALKFADTALEQRNVKPADCYVNATSLGAAKLCNDNAMYPIRGQTVLVKGEAAAIRTKVGKDCIAYCIPRPGSGTTILGGTKEVGVWNEQVDESTTERILENCRALAPELLSGTDGGFQVVSVQCGLRPGRHGGARMEIEEVGPRTVVHAYGHAGAGYQNSIGAARDVLDMVNKAIKPASKL